MPPLVLEDETLAALDRIHAGQLLDNALAYLPADQAEAVRARIVDEREYEDIARELRTSEAVVRKRVSRGSARCADTWRTGHETSCVNPPGVL